METRLLAPWSPTNDSRLGTPVASSRERTPASEVESIRPMASAGNTFRWAKLRTVSSQIYDSHKTHGRPSCLCCTEKWIIVGTEAAEVLVFTFDQRRVTDLTLVEVAGTKHGAVTALSVSENGKIVAAGFSEGYVAAWSLEKSQLLLYVPPLQEVPQEDSKFQDQETHVLGTSVTFVGFNMDSGSLVIISGDSMGMLFHHAPTQVFMRRHIKSRKLAGHYVQRLPTTLLAMLSIRAGTLRSEPTLLICLTPHALSIYSLWGQATSDRYPQRVVFRFPRILSKHNDTTVLSGCLAWSQSTKSLAFSWSDQITIMNIKWSDEPTPKLYADAEKALKCPESIVFVSWLDTSLLIAITVSMTALVIGIEDMTVLETFDIQATRPIHRDHFSAALHDGADKVIADAYFGSFQTRGPALFVLGQYELVYGTLTSWADRIMEFLNKSKPTDAVLLAIQYYQDSSDLSAIGLNASNRREAVRQTLPDIVLTSLRYALEHDTAEMPRLLSAAFQAIFITETPMLEQLLEVMEGTEFERLYVDKLLPFIFDGWTDEVPPHVFQVMVKHLVDDKIDQFGILVLDLTPQSLDIDLAFSVSKVNHLDDVEIYLFSYALRDYITPLREDYNALRKYSFLAYSLTGRIYPTSVRMAQEDAVLAQTSIYRQLFLSSSHDLLLKLIRDDAASFLNALDEAFEDAFLNEDDEDDNGSGPPINRQIIVNILIELFEDPELSGSSYKVQLAIFLARNYPKYPQFLFITGTFLERVITTLVTRPDGVRMDTSRRAELALIALLSAYTPTDINGVLVRLHEAGYHDALSHIYESQGNFGLAIESAISNEDDSKLWPLLRRAFVADSAAAIRSIRDNLESLANRSKEDLAELLIRHNLGDLLLESAAFSPQLQYAVLAAFYKKLEDEGGSVPSRDLNDMFVKALAPRDGQKLIELLMYVLVKPSDVKLQAVVDDLIANERTDALVLLMTRLDRSSEAMIYLLDHIDRSHEDSKELDHYAILGAELCEDVSRNDPTAGREMWRGLLQTLMSISYTSPAFILRLTDASIDHRDLLVGIVSDIIADDASHGQDLERVSNLVTGIFVSLRQRQAMLIAIKDIVNKEKQGDVVQALNRKLEGWSVTVDGDCEACGRKIVGVGIDAEQVYSMWEARMRKHTAALFESDDNLLVVFQCGHTYHETCLKRLTSKMECIAMH